MILMSDSEIAELLKAKYCNLPQILSSHDQIK